MLELPRSRCRQGGSFWGLWGENLQISPLTCGGFAGSHWHSLSSRNVTLISVFILSCSHDTFTVRVYVCSFPFFIRAQSYWITSYLNDVFLTWSPLQRPYFQMRLHSEALRIRTPAYIFGGRNIIQEEYEMFGKLWEQKVGCCGPWKAVGFDWLLLLLFPCGSVPLLTVAGTWRTVIANTHINRLVSAIKKCT